MTTVAWDGITLASDTLGATLGGLKIFAQKTWRLKDGRLFGGSGPCANVIMVKDWIDAGMPKDHKPDVDEFSGVLIERSGMIWHFDEGLVPLPIHEFHWAIGSGRDFALAAMHLGRNAEEAVEIAARFDMWTGGEVTTLTFSPGGRSAYDLDGTGHTYTVPEPY